MTVWGLIFIREKNVTVYINVIITTLVFTNGNITFIFVFGLHYSSWHNSFVWNLLIKKIKRS